MLRPEEEEMEEVLREFEQGSSNTENTPEVNTDGNNELEEDDFVPDNIVPEGNAENDQEGDENGNEGNESGESEEENPEASSDDPAGKETFEPVTLKSRNVTMVAKSMDELIKMANLGLDYTKKTQMLSPHRKKIKMIENSGITDEDLVLLKDIKNGNPAAMKKLMGDMKFDAFDVDSTEGEYIPTQLTEVSDAELEGEDIIAEIRSDSEGTQKLLELTQNIPDQKFVNVLASNPQNLKTFYEDVKAGIAEEAITEALRISTLNNIPFGQAYIQVASNLWNQRNNPENANANNQPTEKMNNPDNNTGGKKPNASLSAKMKSGMNGGKHTQSNNGVPSIDDIMNMDEDVFLTKLDGLNLRS